MHIAKNNIAFRVMIIAQFFNNIGSSFFNIVFLVYAATLPNKTFTVTLVAVAEFLPSLLSVFLGNFADKTSNHLRAWAISRLTQAAIFLGVTVILWHFGGRLDSFFGLVILIFIVDIIGIYSNLLMKPVSRYILADHEIHDAMSLEQAVSITVSMIGSFVGIGMLGLLNQNYALFSLMNVTMFILAWFIMVINHKYFQLAEKNIESTPIVSIKTGMFKHLQITFNYVRKDTLFFQLLLLATAINFVGTSMSGLFNLTLLHTNSLIIGNFGTTVALFGAVESIFMLLGSIITHDFLRQLTTKQLIGIACIISAFIGLLPTFYPNGILWMVLMATSAYVSAKVNPKIGVIIMQRVSSDKLASVGGLINTMVMSSAPVGQILFLGAANIISPSFSWLLVALLFSLLAIYIIMTNKQDLEKVEN